MTHVIYRCWSNSKKKKKKKIASFCCQLSLITLVVGRYNASVFTGRDESLLLLPLPPFLSLSILH